MADEADIPHAPESSPEAGAQPEVPANTSSLVVTCISLLAARAWEALGLIPNPTTKKIERNLDDAQLAIDAAAALADLVRPRVPETERRELENLIATLRINFVEQKSKSP